MSNYADLVEEVQDLLQQWSTNARLNSAEIAGQHTYLRQQHGEQLSIYLDQLHEQLNDQLGCEDFLDEMDDDAVADFELQQERFQTLIDHLEVILERTA